MLRFKSVKYLYNLITFKSYMSFGYFIKHCWKPETCLKMCFKDAESTFCPLLSSPLCLISMSLTGRKYLNVKACLASCISEFFLHYIHALCGTCALTSLSSAVFPLVQRGSVVRNYWMLWHTAYCMTPLSQRRGSPEAACVAKWTVHCFQTQSLSNTVPEWIILYHTGCSLEGSFSIMLSSCMLLLSIQKNWGNMCGEHGDVNSVHCVAALLKQTSAWKWALVFLCTSANLSKDSCNAETKEADGGNSPVTQQPSTLHNTHTHTCPTTPLHW